MASIPVAREVRRTIERAGPGRFWTLADFAELRAPKLVAAALTKLHEEGRLKRYGRGLYFAPRKTIIGEAPPAPLELARMLARGDRLVLAGLSAYNRLGLTTQVPARPIIATKKRLGTDEVEVVHRDLERYGEATDEAIMFLDAVGHIGEIPDCPPRKAIERLRVILRSEQLAGVTANELARVAMNDRPGVKALVGLLGDLTGGLSQTWRRKLQEGLNPLTRFKVSLPEDVAPSEMRREWQIA